jgi:hypothetical protein
MTEADSLATLLPAVTGKLRSKGPETLAQETNLLRMPLWWPRDRPVQLDLLAPTIVYGHEFRQVSGTPLTVTDQRLFTELTTAYILNGCPDHFGVPFSLRSACTWLGWSEGGRQFDLIKRSLARLAAARFQAAFHGALNETAGEEGSPKPRRTAQIDHNWGLVQEWATAETSDQDEHDSIGVVFLTRRIVRQILADNVTFLNAPTWSRVASRDRMAALLWTFLEAERLPWRYQLFANRPGNPTALAQNMPAIAELLHIDDWNRRSHARDRVAEACAVIEEEDKRYQLSVEPGQVRGMYTLTARRVPHQVTVARGFSGLPGTVVSAWRAKYGAVRPSKSQATVIKEVLTRRTTLWVAETLGKAKDDPFRHILDRDTQESKDNLAAAARRERLWADEKAREQSENGAFFELLARRLGRDPVTAIRDAGDD